MFCPECGTPNGEYEERCVRCGALLQSNVAEEGKEITFNIIDIKNKIIAIIRVLIDFAKKHKKIVVPAAAVLIAICIFVGIGNSLSNPERLVKKYMDAYKSQNYKDIYSLLDLDRTEFVNKDTLAKIIEKDNPPKIERYNIKADSYSSGSDDLIKTYIATYTERGSSSPRTMTIKLVRKDKNMLLFFPQYKVAADDLSATYSIRTVEGAVVKVEGVKIDPSEDDPGLYYIGNMLNGWKYNYTITHPAFEEKSGTFETYRGDEEISVNDFKINPAAKVALVTLTKENWDKICSGALSEKSFSDIGLDYCGEESLEDLQEEYEEIYGKINKEGGLGVQELNLSEYTDESGEDALRYDLTYRCSLGFDYTYVLTKKNWNGEVETVTQTEPEDGSVVMNYRYTNAGWQLESIYDYDLYF